MKWNHFLKWFAVLLTVNSDDVLDVSWIISHYRIQVAFKTESHLKVDFVQVKSCIVIEKVFLGHLRDEWIVFAHQVCKLNESVDQRHNHYD